MKKIFTLLFLATLSLGLYAQQQVSGVVVYENGEPVIGASIQAKGSSKGTISDYDGKFEMEIPESVKTLVVSYVGMETQEVAVGKNLKITMKENSEVIQEVVVTGYGNVSKGSFAGSAQAVNAENIEKKSPSEISKALAGEVAGVQVVTTTGQPGEAASIRIRGIGSLNASSAPLYIVDGVPYEAAYISTIDPGDIASTTILKDATATSLYGSRGANGVIVITTKKGTSGEQGKIDVDVKYGGNMRLLPMYDVITDPQEFAEMAWMSLYNSSTRVTQIARIQEASNLLFGPKGIPTQYNLWQVVNPDGSINTNPSGTMLIGNNGKFLGAEDGVQYKPGMDNLLSWRDAIFRTGQKLDATLRISGGTEKTTYFTSIGYLKDEGYYIGSTYDRLTIRSNVDFEPKKWLKGNVNMAYTYSKHNAAGQGDNMNSGFVYVNQMAPVFPVYLYNADGSIQIDPKTGGYAYDYGMIEGSGRPFGSGINPAGSLRYDRDYLEQHYVSAGGSLEFKFYKDLKLTINASLQYRGATESEHTNAYYGDAGGIGRIAKEQDNSFWVTAQQLLEYNKTINEHSIRAMIGHETQYARSSYMYGSKSHAAAYEGENVLEWGNFVQNTTITSATNSTSLESFLATASYIYNERYGLTANYRADGSSKFAKGKRWGHFGSVGGTWMFTNESFMETSKDWIKDGKLRLSWGVLGNQGGIGTQLFQDTYSIEYVDGDVAYIWETKGNPNLTWERSQIVDLGLEFSINKYLNAEIDYFWKNTDNMLFYRPVAPSLGYTSVPINGGAMVNQGVELQFNVHAVDTRNVKLDFRLNGAHYSHKITKLPEYLETEEDMIMAGSLAVGHSPYDWNLPEYAGINEKGEAQYVGYYDPSLGGFGGSNSADNLQIYGRTGNNYVANVYEYMQKYYPGKKASDVLATQIVSGSDSRYAGSNYVGKSRIPDFAGGFGLDLDAYGFSFSVTCSYGIGGYGYDVVYAELMNSDKIGKCNWHVDMRNAWNDMMTDAQKAAVVAQGVNAIPRLSNGTDTYANMTSTRFLTSLSFLSLNNIRIGYTFPKKWMEKIKFKSLNIYVSADNLAIASARKGYNPMASFTGTSDSYQYTPLSTIMGGIKFQF
ncbi:MAG: SusC/RagA family TonB-linked outer membrane protein [Paludibacteraceae bacterium]|nr:SusC/RagA family TonB-linked outer membrane protein [Paludibacteraceae bacterium]